MSLYIPRFKPIWPKKKANVVKPDLETQALKDACFTDFGLFMRTFFAGHVWGEFSEFHQEIINWERRPDRRGSKEVIAAPRGNAKTVFKVIAKVVHSIVYGYQPFTVIIGYSAQEAEGKVKDIRDELLHNEALIKVYGRLLDKRAGTQSFIAKNNCMVLARGRGGQVRGLRHGLYRPTHIICDDVEELEACQSPLQREKTLNWFKKDVMPAGQSGQEYGLNLTFVGTVLHEDSLLANLLVAPSWEARKYRAIESWASRQDLWDKWKALFCNLDDPDRAKTAETFYKDNEAAMLEGVKVLWPSNKNETYYGLMLQHVELGTAAFSSEKQNEPFDPESQVLDPSLCPRFEVHTPDSPDWHASLNGERFVIYRADGKTIRGSDLKVIAFMDPALGKSDKNGKPMGDYTAIVVCGQDKVAGGYIYVLDVWLKKRPPSQYVPAAFEMNQRWGLDVLYLEEVGAWAILKDKFALEQEKWPEKMRIIGVGQHKEKLGRIGGMQIYFENKWLHLRDVLDPEFINQLRLFPTVHDDGPDALEGAVTRLRKPNGSINVITRAGTGVI